MRLQKWHGLGNDYLFLDTRSHRPAASLDPGPLARILSDRRRGPGADGLILLESSSVSDADLRMSIRNADGSDGGVCGNGLRCAAAWCVADELVPTAARVDGDPDRIRIEIGSGISTASVHPCGGEVGRWSVAVDLPPPRLDLAAIPARPFEGGSSGSLRDVPVSELWSLVESVRPGAMPEATRWSLVSTGNPHLVARLPDDADLDAIDLATIGPRLEHDSHFPERINAHLATAAPDGAIRLRTWERGSGLTQACGTGACAAVVAFVAAGLRDGGSPVVVRLPGGVLEIAWSGGSDAAIRMTGEAERVARIEIDDRWIERRLATDGASGRPRV